MKKLLGDIIILHMCTINGNHKMYGSWNMECDRQNLLSFWTTFCPFNPHPSLPSQKKAQKIKILKKWKKTPGDIWCVTDVIIIFHFGLFWGFLLPQQPEKWKWQKKHLKISSSFYTCVPKIMIRWTIMIIILQKCTKNHHHMLHCSCDMACDRCNCYFSFFHFFFNPFTSLTAPKIKIFKKWKRCLEISFYTCVPKIMIRWCIVPEIWCATDGRTDGRIDGKSDI